MSDNAVSPARFFTENPVRQAYLAGLAGAAMFAAAMLFFRPSGVKAADKPTPPSRTVAAIPAANAPARKANAQIRGFSIQLTDPKGRDAYLKAIDDLADMGCTWINFVVAARQDDVKSEVPRIVWHNIPSEKDIQRLLRHAKARGISTMLMPIVLLDHAGSKEWRGVIAPNNWDNWFASYTLYITYMAKLANSCDVDLFCVGSELLSTESFTQRWKDVIGQVRKEFHGKLTYSANWDHYDRSQGGPTFWDQLDYIGMNNYNELSDKPGATVEQLNKAWEPIKKDILSFVDKQHKPFFFTEVGWHNLENTINQPWNYVAEGNIDLNEQLHAYQSFVETWSTVPSNKCMGAFVWEWRPGSKAQDHGTYSLQGTPALEVVKKWMQTR
jgi:hypothetical protein